MGRGVKGFKIICMNCGSDDVSIDTVQDEEEGSISFYECFNCGLKYGDFFGHYSINKKDIDEMYFEGKVKVNITLGE